MEVLRYIGAVQGGDISFVFLRQLLKRHMISNWVLGDLTPFLKEIGVSRSLMLEISYIKFEGEPV